MTAQRPTPGKDALLCVVSESRGHAVPHRLAAKQEQELGETNPSLQGFSREDGGTG